MINAGDRVKFLVDKKWFEGKVIIITPPAARAGTHYYYVKPDSDNDLKYNLLTLNSDLSSLQKSSYDFVNDIQNYTENKVVYIFGDGTDGDNIQLLSNNTIIEHKNNGCNCNICNQYVDMAEPNQPDNISFLCYSCKSNPMRAYY